MELWPCHNRSWSTAIWEEGRFSNCVVFLGQMLGDGTVVAICGWIFITLSCGICSQRPRLALAANYYIHSLIVTFVCLIVTTLTVSEFAIDIVLYEKRDLCFWLVSSAKSAASLLTFFVMLAISATLRAVLISALRLLVFGWMLIMMSWTFMLYNAFAAQEWKNLAHDLVIVETFVLYIAFAYLGILFVRAKCSPDVLDVHVGTDRQILIQNEDFSHEHGDIVLGPGDEESNFLSKLVFYWTNDLMKKGYKGALNDVETLYTLPQALKPALWTSILSSGDTRSTRSLSHILHKLFGVEYYSLAFLKLANNILTFLGPVLLNYLVSFMENPGEPIRLGYYYSAALFGSTLIGSLCGLHYSYRVNMVGLKVRNCLTVMFYQKLVRVPQSAVNQFTTGQLVNFMSTDVDRIVNFCPSFHVLWSVPFEIAVAFYLLYREIGLSFLAGVGFTIVLIPFNRWLAGRISFYSTRTMEAKDARVKIMAELLSGIRVVKCCSWEGVLSNRINELRSKELSALKGMKYLDALCVYLWASAPVVIGISAFATYVLLGHKLTAAKVFTSVALFNVLIGPLNAFPWIINGVVEAWISLKRLQAFFDVEDFSPEKYYLEVCSEHDSSAVCCIHDGCFGWVQDCEVLHNICLDIESGKLIGLSGSVGSGKSSLFASILGEMFTVKPHSIFLVTTNYQPDESKGVVSLFTQELFLMHGTIRDNILFGEPFDKEWYDRVVFACALLTDFTVFPLGDLTLVGDQGATLSGGQRTRVALARAVYRKADVYLLDDPLSAVDPNVCEHIYNEVICGLLFGKSVILATHRRSYLKSAHRVICMNEGRIVGYDSPECVLEFQRKKLPSIAAGEMVVNDGMNYESIVEDGESDIDTENEEESSLSKFGTEHVLVPQEEEKEVGYVKKEVYLDYLKAIGFFLVVLIASSLTLMQGSRNISDWWLSHWVTEEKPGNETSASLPGYLIALGSGRRMSTFVAVRSEHLPKTVLDVDKNSTYFYLSVYGSIVLANTLFTLARAFLYAFGGIVAARRLHKDLLNKIIFASSRFFDVTPFGRILNRFSSDMYAVDYSMPFEANIFLANIFGILGTLCMTCYGLPWFAIFLIPMGLVYFWIQRYYRCTTCEVKRLSSTTLSPMYSHFTDTLNGLMLVRAFKETKRFEDLNIKYLGENVRARFSGLACSQWLATRLQALGVICVTAVAFLAILEHNLATVNPGLVGLALSYALAITGLLNGGITSFTETEKQLVSVERVLDYIKSTPSEKWKAGVSLPQLNAWPLGGEIEFVNVELRYSPDLPPALKSISFNIAPKEKIGICGRSGSGKSSLFQALFRTTELSKGTVMVDSVDIANLDLTTLRSAIGMIPQTPFLFSGSLRSNIDVNEAYDEEDILESISIAGMMETFQRNFPDGLSTELQERGGNMSVGQRQIVCLIRALLMNVKIMCIDEATAHIDHETERDIQRAIFGEGFRDVTVLCIAHRLDLLTDFDRIFVFDGGRLIEQDKPKALLSKHNSAFIAMFNKS